MKKIKKITVVIIVTISLIITSIPAFATVEINSKLISALSDYYAKLSIDNDTWFINSVLPIKFDNYNVVVSAFDGSFDVVTKKEYGNYIFEMPSAFAPSEIGLLLVDSDTKEVIPLEEAYDNGIVDLDKLYSCYKNNSEEFLCTIRENKADFSQLKYLVESYDKGYYFLPGNIYSKESIERLSDAYDNAKAVLANENSTQDIVDKAYNALNTAIGSMEVIGGCCAPYLLGDTNRDNILDVNDVTKLQIFLAKIENIKENNNHMYADVNQDRYVDVNDVTDIQMYLAGYESEHRINQLVIEFYHLLEK